MQLLSRAVASLTYDSLINCCCFTSILSNNLDAYSVVCSFFIVCVTKLTLDFEIFKHF